jgi:mRNA-degrading endonuclease RelE of RelBE toxin-antitoxin system
MRVLMTAEAQTDYARLPMAIQARVASVVERLTGWPDVSGAKPMRGGLKGHYRIRTGDWRVLFQVKGDVVIIRIAHRSTVYDD